MVVRFLPIEREPSRPPATRGDLAEVIELRARMVKPRATNAGATEPKHGAREAEVVQLADSKVAVARAELTEIEQQVGLGSDALEATHNSSETIENSAEADAVRLLARRARSSGELRRELAALGHSATDVEEVVLHCEGSLYLDDLGLARVLTEGLRERKRASRGQIRLKLRDRLLPDGVIEQALSELNDDEEDELLRKAASDRAGKLKGLERQTAERRLLGFLARRGWGGERAVRVAREALDNAAARGTVRFR